MDIRQGDAFICWRNDVIFSRRLAPTHRPLRRAQLAGWVADRSYRSSGKRSGPPLLGLTKMFHCALQDKKYSIMLWNTHCEGIIPADMTDMTVDMPFCVFEPTRPSSTVLMSLYIIRLLPVACKLSYALLARTHASRHALRGSFVLRLTYVMHSLSFKLKPTWRFVKCCSHLITNVT